MKNAKWLSLLLLVFSAGNAVCVHVEAAEAMVYPAAIFPFEERGANVKDYGPRVSDILFAELVSNPTLYLVDRAEMEKTIGEQALNVSGVVKPGEAAQVGQLTGAKLLITGSVLQADKKLFLVAKIMGTETTRVLGASVNGKSSDDIAPLVKQLAEQIGKVVNEQGDKLVAKKAESVDRLENLKKTLSNRKLPAVRIEVAERHVGQSTIDPAAETELAFLCTSLGFDVIDAKEGTEGAADILITGEGFSETAGRVGGLVGVKARVELKAVDRKTGKVLAADRQTALVVDSTEQIAGKAALQEAAGTIAERLLPKLLVQPAK